MSGATRASIFRRWIQRCYTRSPWAGSLARFSCVGGLDRIYVHSPDWLARNYAYQVLLIDEWRRAGVEVVFLNRSLGQSPEDDLLLQVQGIVSEYERAKIMERSRRGKKHVAQRGSLNVMSNAPYGYRYISVHDGGGQARFELIAEQADVVKDISPGSAASDARSEKSAAAFRGLAD
jgi:DNA invertase Pin-like site-specific DNA recombinase